ncbi:unnamed protein product [Strongylus vulgaris]|uniref:Uncharacterized protein n=1 Tax=Strongylus vulgaris TaxID=40348 RepID=A0A3P7K9J6_STRVU|nr:unnamed protein product [Strongylus vulgaris]
MTEEEKAEQLRIEQEEAAKAIKKRVIKDGHSEKEVCELEPHQHEVETGKSEVIVVPTYVRPVTEKVPEESANRFADKKVPTDHAYKHVIQPPKLETAAVQKVETKVAPE